MSQNPSTSPQQLEQLLAAQLGPVLEKMVQEEVEKRMASEEAPKAKKKRGRPRIPRAEVGGKVFKISSDPAVAKLELSLLKKTYKEEPKRV